MILQDRAMRIPVMWRPTREAILFLTQIAQIHMSSKLIYCLATRATILLQQNYAINYSHATCPLQLRRATVFVKRRGGRAICRLGRRLQIENDLSTDVKGEDIVFFARFVLSSELVSIIIIMFFSCFFTLVPCFMPKGQLRWPNHPCIKVLKSWVRWRRIIYYF